MPGQYSSTLHRRPGCGSSSTGSARSEAPCSAQATQGLVLQCSGDPLPRDRALCYGDPENPGPALLRPCEPVSRRQGPVLVTLRTEGYDWGLDARWEHKRHRVSFSSWCRLGERAVPQSLTFMLAGSPGLGCTWPRKIKDAGSK